VVIAGIFVEKLILSIQWLPDRQWSNWEILTLSMTILLLLIYLTKLQRNRKVRRKYQDQFLESTPYMGMSWGAHYKSRLIGKDLKKDQLAPVHKLQNKKNVQTKEPLEKPHERHKAFHSYTNIYKPTRERSEKEISESTADNEKLHCEPTKLAKAESKIAQMTAEHGLLQETIKQLQNEIATNKKAKVSLKKQVSALKADNEKLKNTLAKFEQTESQNRQHLKTLEKLQEENKQLQNEITTHKQARVSFEKQVSELKADSENLKNTLVKFEQNESKNKQHLKTLEKLQEEIERLQNEITTHKQARASFEKQVSELTADNEKLQCELTKLAKAESKIAQMTAEHGLLQEAIKQLQNEIATNKQAKVSFEQQVSELKADNEKLKDTLVKFEQTESKNKQHLKTLEKLQEEIKQFQNEITTNKQARVNLKKQVSELKTDNEKLKDTLVKFEQFESQNKQHLKTLEKLQEEIKQLQNEITTHKQARVSLEKQVSELTSNNEKLQCELTKLAKAESQIAEMTAEFRQLQKEEFQVEQIPEHQIVTELPVETPVNRKPARRTKMYKQQHRTVKGVRQKRCRKCNKWKPESEFHKNSSSKDNLTGSCKTCKNNAARERRRLHEAAQR